MTYAKKGTEFPDDCAYVGLSDAAYRTHDEAITWLYRVENIDLRIAKHLVPRFVGSAHWRAAVDELIAVKFWTDDDDAYVVVHHADVIRQGIVAQQRKRARDKAAQAKARARSVEGRR